MCFLIVENKFDTLVINNDTFIEDLKMDNKAGECLMRALINKKYFIGMGSILRILFCCKKTSYYDNSACN